MCACGCALVRLFICAGACSWMDPFACLYTRVCVCLCVDGWVCKWVCMYIYMCVLLCFDLLTRPKMPFKVMHRQEVIHSNGCYERKLADEVGRGKNIPWYSQRLTHRKRVTSELHDSYFRLMTIKHSISKNDYIIQLSSTSQCSCQ